MKIHFMEVTGSVLIDDRYSCQAATSGLNLETGGKQYIIATGDNSSATLVVESSTISLRPNSFLHVNWPRPRQLRGVVHDVRLVLGKLWSMIDRNELKPDDDPNVAVGVRG